MLRRIEHPLALAAALVVLSASGVARADRETLLIEVAKAAPQVRYFDDEVSVNAKWYDVARGDEKVAQCLAAIQAASKAGVKLGEEWEVPQGYASGKLPHTRSARGQRGGRVYFTSLALLKKYCKGKSAKVQLVRTYLALREASRALTRIDRVTNGTRYQRAALEARVCKREVASALAMRNPKSIQFERPAVTLGDAQKAVCGALAAGLEGAGESIRKQADLSAYHAVLAGDRRKIFDENLLHAAEVYGEGKFPLKDPDDFQNIDAWYLSQPDVDRNGQPAWRVVIYRFEGGEGGKLLSTDSRGGAGRAAPKEAFAGAMRAGWGSALGALRYRSLAGTRSALGWGRVSRSRGLCGSRR